MRRTILVCVLLSAVTLAVYWPVLHHDFVNYDDNCYVVQNRQIHDGLTWQGMAWAFSRLHGDGTYWHPLTWVSHMVDCQLFGLRPAGHHLVNLLIHAINSILVFLLFKSLTRTFWRSALLAALFALHPLQVDTVAWVAERKNLLSAQFFFLTLWAYVRYVEAAKRKAESRKQKAEIRSKSGARELKSEARNPRPEGNPKSEIRSPMPGVEDVARAPVPSSRFEVRRSMFDVLPFPPRVWYWTAVALFACGLMCKPVLVTLPFVLLLLDYWPLRRLEVQGLKSEARKPRPEGNPKPEIRSREPKSRITDHASRITFHISRTTLLPLVLEKLPFFLLSAISCLITIASNRAVGAMADAAAGFPLEVRLQNAPFSYVKYLGKTLWPSNLAVFYPYPDEFPLWRAVACVLLLLAISGLAIAYARSRPYFLVGWFWFLGVLVPFAGLLQAGEQAMADRFAYVPLVGLFLVLVWGAEELVRCRRKQRILIPAAAVTVLVCWAVLSRRQTGYWQNSVTLFSHALAVTDDNARAHANLGLALTLEGKAEEGIQHLLETLRLNPEHAVAHWAVGSGRAGQGRLEEAIQHYEEALNLKPDFPEALNDLAWLRATHPDPKCRNGAAAVELAVRACRLTEQQEPMFIGTLAAAYAEAGRFEDAVKTAEKAKDLATTTRQKELVEKNRQLIELYRVGKPFHQTRTP